MQKAVLIDYIQTELKDYSADEIRIAFRLALNGQLNVEISHFQNFSALYIAQIMKAYSEHRAKAMIEFNRKIDRAQLQPTEPSPEEQARNFWGFVDSFIVEKFEKYKGKKIIEGTFTGFEPVFNVLEKDLKLLQIPVKKKFEIRERAIQIQKERVQTRRPKSMEQARDFRKLAEQALEIGFENTFEHEIKKICFEIAVREFYDALIESGTDLRATIESIKSNQYE